MASNGLVRQFPLAAGIEEGKDPKLLPPGALLVLQNSFWRKEGRVDKRAGTQGLEKSIVGGGSLSAAMRLITRGEELALTDGNTLYSHTDAGWVSRGRITNVGLEWATARAGLAGALASDVVLLANGQIVEVWAEGDSLGNATKLRYQIRELDSDSVVTPPTNFTVTNFSPRFRLVASGNTWVLVWATATTGNLNATTASGTVVLSTGVATSGLIGLDACVIGTDLVAAVRLAAGGIRLVRASIAATPVVAATDVVTGETSALITSIGVTGAVGEPLYITYVDYAGARIRFALANSSTLAQTVVPTTFTALGTGLDGPGVTVARATSTSAIMVCWFRSDSLTAGILQSVRIDNAGNSGGVQSLYGLRGVSRPVDIGGRLYAFARNFQQTTYDTFLIDVTFNGLLPTDAMREAGKLEWLTGGTWADGWVSSPAVVSATRVIAHTPYRYQVLPNELCTGIRLVSITTGAAVPLDMWRSTTIARETYISGGVFSAYDGVECIGYGWPYGPTIDLGGTTTFSTGGSILAGTYIYNVTAERRSAVGVLHRSPVGLPYTTAPALTGSTSRVELEVIAPSLGHSKYTPGILPIYRSIAGGSIVQRETIAPGFMTLEDDNNVSPLLIVDTRADGAMGLGSVGISLATRPPLYTQGGELEDTQPPAFLTHLVHRNRIYGLLGDRRTVAFSKDQSSNPDVAPGFYPTQVLVYPEPMHALGSMDDKFIAFSATRPWYVLGEGPAPDGSQSDFTAPMPIQADVGCTSPRSVVSMPDGIMFVGSRGDTAGFHLLTRGLEVVYVGQSVQDTIEAFPVVTSGVLVARESQIRWTCNSADGTAGRTIVFDYLVKQWTVFTHTDTDAGLEGTPIADACMWNDAWTFVTPSGKVYVEDQTTCLDGGTAWVRQRGEIAWISESGPVGFQRIRKAFLLGDRLTDCDLTLEFAFDHKAGFQQSFTWTSDKLAEFADGANVGMRCGTTGGANPRCRGFRLAWEDGAPSGPGAVVGTGEGINLSAIGLEYIPKPGLDRRSARART